VGENAKTFTTEYGNVSAASIGAIQRNLLTLESQGGDVFFGEPMLDIKDLMQTDAEGCGVINVLAAERLYQSPKLYSTFLLWLLAKIEQVVRLIRSKGVAVYFVTQSPADVPDAVLGQLGNRVQHALRAFTPRDQKAVKTAASTMRANPAFDAATAITELGVGEALVSFLDEKGRPEVVERATVVAPSSRMGPLEKAEREAAIRASVLYGHYEQALDRESAYERLRAQAEAAAAQAPEPPATRGRAGAPAEPTPTGGGLSDMLFGSTGPRGGKRDGLVQIAAKTVTRTVGSAIGRQIVRGLLGSLLGGSRR